MLTEDLHLGRAVQHEEAAHQKRNWVRLTFDCNDRCIFCLDSDSHDGEIRDPAEIKAQILDGRRKGAERLILSGGEPTIHPRFVDFVKLGRLCGYPKIQTVTNGRMFRYREFLTRAIDAGLSEITFSIHGPNAKIHDALVGVKGAFDEEVEGLRNALADGRPVVNIDVCVNRGNVKQLPALIETFAAMGVREFDLLQVIPFGRAFIEGRDTLFYDLEEAKAELAAAFAWSRKPDFHVWLNRFPPAHCEGYEELIQDPYKLNDEVRGRKEEFARLIERGVALDCREPARCRYCYLEQLCDTFEEVRATALGPRFDVVRVDSGWESQQGPVFGGDPASARRARREAAAADNGDGKRRLPMMDGPADAIRYRAPEELARAAGAQTLLVVAPSLAEARDQARRFDLPRLALELDDYADLAGGSLDGRTIVSAVARTPEQAESLLAIDAAFEVIVTLTRATEPWLLSLVAPPDRLVLRQPTWERLTESRESDVDLRAFFARFTHPLPVEGVPACVTGRIPRPPPRTLDTAMATADGTLEIFRYTKRFIADHYMTKSLRCRGCAHDATCRGLHVNHVRAHGFAVMQPVAL